MAKTSSRRTSTTRARRAAKKPAVAVTATARPPVPRATEVAEFLGVKLTRRLTTEQIQRLRKPLPGYASQLDDAARKLALEPGNLGLPDVTPEALLATHAEQESLASREAVAESVYYAVYEQRQVVDDRGMGMLQKLARRIDALAEDDPDLPIRWKALIDFLGKFRGGGRPPRGGGAPTGGG